MPSLYKKERVKQIKKWFDASDSLLVLNYKGLSVSEANDLRVTLTGMDSQLRVVKNTITRIAIADSDKEGIAPLIDGPVAVVFVNQDPAAVAKTIRDFGKGRQEFYLRGGLLEGRVLDGKQVEAFAALPSREVLLAQLVGMVQAPLARVVGAVAAPARKMLGLFKALESEKAATETQAEPVSQEPSAEAKPEPIMVEEPAAEAEVGEQEANQSESSSTADATEDNPEVKSEDSE